MKKNTKPGHAEIHFSDTMPVQQVSSGDKKIFKPEYFVRYLGGNKEIISSSEPLTSKANCIKNILSHIRLSKGNHVTVVDTTTRSRKQFILNYDGIKLELRK